MAPDSVPSRKGMTSLYANLLGSPAESSPGTISSAPVTYKQPAEAATQEQDEAAKKQQALAGRSMNLSPQIQAQKAKAKAIAAKFAQPPSAVSDAPAPSIATTPTAEKVDAPTPPAQPSAPKTTLADWTADDDVNDFYGGEKRQRGGRKKRKKNRGFEEIPQDWDDIYDPSRPNNYEEYKNSDEKIREIREWKDRLYAHRTKRRETTSDYDSEEEERRPLNNQFAPPAMSFAPPKSFNEPEDVPPPPPPAEVPDDATGDDAYARRMRMSQQQRSAEPPPPPPPTTAPALPAAGQISRAPVRYNFPPPPPGIPASEAELEEALASEASTPGAAADEETEDAPRSKRPGQAGFAERLLSKYGWTKGSGLGASGSGIVNPLYAKVDKRKKKSDAEGGGFATPAGQGKILGGHKDKKGQADEEGKFGKMSEIIVLKGMLRGLDLEQELNSGGIMQEIGEECGEKYGTVERVYIHRKDAGEEDEGGPLVFVKFTSQLSGLRAVNALEGRIFGGNEIRASFFEREKFDDGVYE